MSDDTPKPATAICAVVAGTLGLIMAAVRGDSAFFNTLSFAAAGALIGYGIDKMVESSEKEKTE